MKKILEKIYSEDDEITNISLFIASIFALVAYFYVTDIVLLIILFIATFSLSKVLCKIISNFFFQKDLKKELVSNYSDAEASVIKEFIKRGGCGITYSEEESVDLSKSGLNSLIARNIITRVDGSLGGMVGGLYLDENIYKAFLDK